MRWAVSLIQMTGSALLHLRHIRAITTRLHKDLEPPNVIQATGGGGVHPCRIPVLSNHLVILTPRHTRNHWEPVWGGEFCRLFFGKWMTRRNTISSPERESTSAWNRIDAPDPPLDKNSILFGSAPFAKRVCVMEPRRPFQLKISTRMDALRAIQ